MKNALIIRIKSIGLLLILILVIGISPAFAITWGTECEEDEYPNVCMMGVAVNGEPVGSCSGTLIALSVVLTAGHCIENILSLEQFIPPELITVQVFFDLTVPPGPPLPVGLEVENYFTHPLYYWGPQSNPHDVGVLILEEPVADITPAVLPTQGLLDELKAEKVLSRGSSKEKFTAVGYGGTLEWPPPMISYDFTRRYSESEYRALLPAWLKLSQNHATGDGGSCFGDSGGPVFWENESGQDILVGITSWGDPNCISPSFNYRVDTPETLDFIESVIDGIDDN